MQVTNENKNYVYVQFSRVIRFHFSQCNGLYLHNEKGSSSNVKILQLFFVLANVRQGNAYWALGKLESSFSRIDDICSGRKNPKNHKKMFLEFLQIGFGFGVIPKAARDF